VTLQSSRIGVIGAGAMGCALASGLRDAGVPKDRLRLSDVDPDRLSQSVARLGVESAPDNVSLVGDSDVVILAVKPGDLTSVVREAADARPLWISIAAGVSLESILDALPGGARAVRAMPNTPALVGKGATAFVATASATSEDRSLAEAIFGAVGVVWEAPSEALLDAVTGLSGSGPAYIFVLLEALADAGVRQGLPRDAAQLLATQTVLGAAQLALETGGSPAQLKDQVTSPGGTTIAGLAALEAAGFRSSLYEAVAAATARSKELGK
jgi:pyrroline-5-carboxylate reductase